MIPKENYLSAEIARLEKERLWPRVWQMAGRLEQISSVGSYITYDIGDDSVIVMRVSKHGIKAFHNACQHRGRRLLDGEGQSQEISCRFHGWRWNLDGSIKTVTERNDWAGCPHMTDQDIALKPVECLSVCKRPCTVALAAPGKWTYVVGDLICESHLEDIVIAARRYAASPEGIVPWRERPLSFRKGVVSRTPPLASPGIAPA